jgi:hypothetical protein
MVSKSLLTAACVIVVIIVVVFVVMYTSSATGTVGSDERGALGWGNIKTAGPCYTYRYPPQEVNGLMVPSSQSRDSYVVENIAEKYDLMSCIYSDELNLALTTKECITVVPGDNPLNLCINEDGTQAPLGTVVQYYDDGPCAQTSCPGTLVATAVNYYPRLDTAYCLAFNQGAFTMLPCSAADPMQMIYEELDGSSLDPPLPKLMTPVSLYFRKDSLCLYREPGVVSVGINPSYAAVPDCQSFEVETRYTVGNNIVLGDCGDAPNWAWLSSFNIDNTLVPRQLVYIEGLDFTDAPQDGPSLIDWLAEQGAQSLYWSGFTDQIAQLNSVAKKEECATRPFNSEALVWSTIQIEQNSPIRLGLSPLLPS